MKITVIGSGAMGGLFSCLLSTKNEVTVIDLNKALIDKIRQDGFSLIGKDGKQAHYHMEAKTNSEGMEKQDLVILFVKSMFNTTALEANKGIIGPDTFLMSMQNGMGHEEVLKMYADNDHVILGTTQHNASIEGLGENKHNGVGPSALCNLSGKTELCSRLAETLSEAGIDTTVNVEVKKMIWDKLFTNISASILTGVLQVNLGYIVENESTYAICKALIREGVAVAKADGFDFSYDQKVMEVTKVCSNTPSGVTSIYYDLKQGNRTEVDFISGAVLKIAQRHGISAPVTETVVNLIHAFEGKVKK